MKRMLLAMSILLVVLTACGGQMIGDARVAYKPNPDWTPGGAGSPIVGSVRISGEKLEEGWVEDEAANVPEGQFGLYLLDGAILTPGLYRQVPSDFVRYYSAAVVAQGLVAIAKIESAPNEYRYELLETGYHAVDVNSVVFFPVGTQRYRTLSGDSWEAYDKGDLKPCGGGLVCETSLDKSALEGTTVLANINVDVVYEHVFDSAECLERSFELRDPVKVVQNFIGTPLRGARDVTGVYTPEEIKLTEVQNVVQEMYLEILRGEASKSCLAIASVTIRSVEVGDKAYQNAQSAAEAALESERLRAEQLALEQQNLAAEQSVTATQAAFDRQQDVLDAENQAEVLRIIFAAVGSEDPETVRAVLQVLYPNVVVTPTPPVVTIVTPSP